MSSASQSCYFDRQPPPSPRYDHAASIHAQRYLLVFGGCSHSTCFNDLHVLDLHTVSESFVAFSFLNESDRTCILNLKVEARYINLRLINYYDLAG